MKLFQAWMSVLITGAAGFIGYHVATALLRQGVHVIGYDNINSYYDTKLKRDRISTLNDTASLCGCDFSFVEADLQDKSVLDKTFIEYSPSCVVNLAAQAGVRYSLENPSSYIQSNIVGFCNILECSRRHNVKNFIYASSSSVYGGNTRLPFSEDHGVDHPVSLYAATKKANELMAHSYSHLYGLPTTGLRFFTVYGPWGRPDMALQLFTKSILSGTSINIFNHGNMVRDFTYIDDIVASIVRLMDKPASSDPCFDSTHPNPSTSWAPYRIFNIGNSKPVPLMDYIHALEEALEVKAEKNFLPMQPGDVAATSADTTALESWIGFKPSTPIKQGIENYIRWYRRYYLV